MISDLLAVLAINWALGGGCGKLRFTARNTGNDLDLQLAFWVGGGRWNLQSSVSRSEPQVSGLVSASEVCVLEGGGGDSCIIVGKKSQRVGTTLRMMDLGFMYSLFLLALFPFYSQVPTVSSWGSKPLLCGDKKTATAPVSYLPG